MKPAFLKLLALLALTLLGGAALADPPARVGRIAYTEGAVEFRATYDGEAAPALQNWPLTSANVITTGPGARVELTVGSSAVRLDADSELEIAALDDDQFQLRLLQGSLNASINTPELAQDFELATAQGRLTLAAPSQLHVDAGRSLGTTVVNLFAGAGRFDGARQTLTLVAGQRAEVGVNGTRVGSANRDDFDLWSLTREQRAADSVAARYVSPETTGYQDLDQYGSWDTSLEYGAVWYPSAVPAGWAPYRNGSWAWIEPWGWTWVDSAPWGYAPFHYGRWAFAGNRWGWVPGERVARPVWAPALVGWVGGGNWSAHFSSGSAPAVGWFPLAPRETYRPGYAVSPTYLQRLNRHYSGRPDPQALYRDRLQHNAVTAIPQERFQQRRRISVSNTPALIDAPRQLNNAPLSAAVPATIARPPQAAPRTRSEQRREQSASVPGRQPPPQPAAPAPADAHPGAVLAAPGHPMQRPAPQAFERRAEPVIRPALPARDPQERPAPPQTQEREHGWAPSMRPNEPLQRQRRLEAPAPQRPPSSRPEPSQPERWSGPIHAAPPAVERAPRAERSERVNPVDAGQPRAPENRPRDGQRRGDSQGNR